MFQFKLNGNKVMETKQFNEIPIRQFGNDYEITGMLYTNQKKESVIVVLPQENVNENNVSIIFPSKEDWDRLLVQSDTNEVEGIRDGQKVILRKGQRNIDSKIMWNVFRRDKYKCRYCGIDFVPMTVDHIITWETGGATHEKNLVCSCRKCNKTRGNLSYREWLNSDYYMSKLQYLSNDVIIKNQDLLRSLDTLPKVKIIRNR